MRQMGGGFIAGFLLCILQFVAGAYLLRDSLEGCLFFIIVWTGATRQSKEIVSHPLRGASRKSQRWLHEIGGLTLLFL
jgi:hypothetical protein